MRYKKPVIAKVMLDPSQAVLATCRAGGAWSDVLGCVYGTTGTPMMTYRCFTGVRGVTRAARITVTIWEKLYLPDITTLWCTTRSVK